MKSDPITILRTPVKDYSGTPYQKVVHVLVLEYKSLSLPR